MQSLPIVQSIGAGHALVTQLIGPVQVTSHWHEVEHSIAPRQLFLPPQATSHAPVPHDAPIVQLIWPLQLIVHAVAPVQSMPPLHVLRPMHSTEHGRPGGHVILLAHELSVSQRITQVSPTHDEHSLGHGGASGWLGGASGAPVDTHQPCMHTRPVGQAPLSHLNAPDRVSIEHPAIRIVISAARITTSLR